MQVLDPHSKATGWITAIINGHWCQAKVYDDPSVHGINNGRVSKLMILKSDKRIPHANIFNQACYNYDRGLDFDNAPAGLLGAVLAELKALPKLFN